jgi:hypothetical protein
VADAIQQHRGWIGRTVGIGPIGVEHSDPGMGKRPQGIVRREFIPCQSRSLLDK